MARWFSRMRSRGKISEGSERRLTGLALRSRKCDSGSTIGFFPVQSIDWASGVDRAGRGKREEAGERKSISSVSIVRAEARRRVLDTNGIL